ncbi:MAG TPA: O-antigen ligase family protein [Pirellulales bacterium]|nr:O-antigen ligase family protein [Pirellulales bacterium]
MKGLIFTYALTYGGAAAALVKPWYGVLIYICFATIRPEWLWFWSVEPGNYSRVIAIATIAGWLIHGFGDWRLGRAGPIAWAYLALFGWAVVSGAAAGFDANVVEYLDLQSKMLLPFFIGLTMIGSVRMLQQAVWTMVGSLGYLALEFNRAYLSGYNPIWPDGFGAMDNNCVAIEMVAGTGAAVFLAMRSERWWQKGLAFAAAILMAHTVMFSNSRGGFLGLLVMTSIAFCLVPKQPRHYLMFAALLAIGVRLAGPGVLARFSTAFADSETLDASAAGRVELWKACWDVMQHQPLLGVGPNHFPLVAPDYGFPKGKEAHSLWLQTGAELGFVGLTMLASFYGTTIVLAWRLIKTPHPLDPWLREIARMVAAGLVGFVVAALFVTINRLEYPVYIALLGAGALKLSSQGQRTYVTSPSLITNRLGRLALRD